MYKLLATDIDATLTTDARSVSKQNYDAIHRARAAGLHVLLATGRSFGGARHICKALELHGPVVSYAGAAINDIDTGEALFTSYMEPELVRELLEIGAKRGMHAHIYQNDDIIYERESAYGDKYAAFLGIERIIDAGIREKLWTSTPKVLFISEPERMEELEAEFSERFSGVLEVSRSSPSFVELSMAGASKGTALKWLCENHFFVRQEEVAAVGDNTLDHSMLLYAGLSAAVENASNATRALAGVTVPSCADNGVAWLIDNVLLKG